MGKGRGAFSSLDQALALSAFFSSVSAFTAKVPFFTLLSYPLPSELDHMHVENDNHPQFTGLHAETGTPEHSEYESAFSHVQTIGWDGEPLGNPVTIIYRVISLFTLFVVLLLAGIINSLIS